MRGQLRAVPTEKREAMRKIGNTRVKSDAVPIKVKVIGFQTKKGKDTDVYNANNRKDASVIVRLVDVDDVKEKRGVMQYDEKTGLPEVFCSISVDAKKEKVHEDPVFKYIQKNYADAAEGDGEKYKGTFSELVNYWDPVKNTLANGIWYPLKDKLGNPLVFSLNIWAGDIPADIKPGMILDVPGCSFDVYVAIPKPKGNSKNNNEADAIAAKAAIAKAEKEAKNINAPHQPDGSLIQAVADADAAEGVSKISPTVRISGNVNSGVFVSRDYIDCPPLDSFSAEICRPEERRRHQLRMPDTHNDTYGIMYSLKGYQETLERLDQFEQGPSNGVLQLSSFEKTDYEKPLAGAAKDDTAREPKKTVRLHVIQYPEEGPVGVRPYTVEFTVFPRQVFTTGITIMEKWLKFGTTPFEGVVIATVDPGVTLSNGLNQPAQLDEFNTNGKIMCWVKQIIWDLRGTCKTNGFPVSLNLIKKLYADIFSMSTREDGTKKVEMDLSVLYTNKATTSRLQSTFVKGENPLHKGVESTNEIINLNEWERDAGRIVSEERDLFLLPYIPIPQQLLEIKEVLDRNEQIEIYNERCRRRIREEFLQNEETFLNIILGYVAVPPREQSTGPDGSRDPSDDFQLYSTEERAALALLKDPKDRARALPGRNTPRIYNPAFVKNIPGTLGWDFMIYAIKKSADEEPQHIAPVVPSSSQKASKKTQKPK